ncbi:TetR/AcrR family transcriptional regulator [Halobacillus salinarum]|uniref:TetR/AcrR family transcriptional regulator n=1 Tax=Halobacillus salinarum TaxID=2932257 RepID=UPI002962341B|nr:TetR/AcrR family transcriptional regulator [Halobacillus salinarum]
MKEKMVKTSIALFGTQGFRETSIQDIVEANGITKGTFYYYFKSKEDMLVHIHESFINHLLEQQQSILEDRHTSNRQKLSEVVSMLINNIRTNADSAMVFFRGMRHLSTEKPRRLCRNGLCSKQRSSG